MDESLVPLKRNYLLPLALAMISCLLLFRMESARSTVPNYVAYDMDLAITIDTVLIQSNLMPDHLAHPGLGLNLVLVVAQKFAHAVGALSSVDLHDLKASLNPLLPAMEITEFNRAVSPWLVLFSVLSLWLFLAVSLELPPLWSLGTLLVLSSQQSWLYQAMGSRTELFAIFFWSVGLAVLAPVNRVGKKFAYPLLALAGFCFGLSFFTKIQVLFYLLGAGAFLFLQLKQAKTPLEGLPSGVNIALSAATALIFGASLLGAYSVQPERGMGTFTSHYEMTPIGYAASLFFGSLLALSILRKEKNSYLSATATLMLGFVLSLASHFMFFSHKSLAVRYLFLDTKMVYLRPAFYDSDAVLSWTAVSERMAKILTLEYLLLGCLLLGFLYTLWRFRSDRYGAILVGTVFFTVLLVLILGNRGQNKDWIWIQTFPTVCAVLTLWWCGLKRSGPFILLALSLFQFFFAADQSENYRRDQSNYGYRPWFFSKRLFSRNHHLYQQVFDEKFQSLDWSGFRRCVQQMTRLTEATEQARSVTGHTNLKRISVAAPGMPALTTDPNFRFENIPDIWNGAQVISGAPGPVNLWTRTDLLIWICVEREPYTALTGSAPGAEKLPFTLTDGTQRLAFFPVRLTESKTFQPKQLGERWFLVVEPVINYPQPLLPPNPTW